MFKRARKVFEDVELQELGQRMEARKSELQGHATKGSEEEIEEEQEDEELEEEDEDLEEELEEEDEEDADE